MHVETWAATILAGFRMDSWLQVCSMLLFVVLVPFFSIVSVLGIRRAAATRLTALFATFPGLRSTKHYKFSVATYSKVHFRRYIAPLIVLAVFNLYMTMILFDGFGWTSGAIKAARPYFILGADYCSYLSETVDSKCRVYEAQTLLTVSFAFLGWMVWTFANVIDRATSLQLFPGTFYRLIIRMIVAVLVVIVLRHFLANDNGNSSLSLPALAFVIGMFPEQGIAFILRQFEKFVRMPNHSDDFPLDLIQGISPSLSFRMNELGINNAVDLAHSNPFGLFDAMAIPMSEIVDWIGQSQLLVRLQPARFQTVQAAGYRTIFDFAPLLETEATTDALKSLYSLTNPRDVLSNLRQAGEYLRLREVFSEIGPAMAIDTGTRSTASLG